MRLFRSSRGFAVVGVLVASVGAVRIAPHRGAEVLRVQAHLDSVLTELATDTALVRWLDTHGLTLAEAARIQVVYAQPMSDRQIVSDFGFLLLAPVSLATSVTTGLWNAGGNADGHSSAVAWTGIVSGGVAVLTGALLQKPEMRQTSGGFGLATAGIGALSIGLSTHSLHRHNMILSAEREAAAKRSVAEASFSPIVTAGGRAGVGMTLRF